MSLDSDPPVALTDPVTPVRPSPSTVAVALVVAGSIVVFDPWGWQPFGPSKWLVITAGSFMAAALAVRAGVAIHRGAALGFMMLVAWSAVTAVTAMDPLAAWIGTPDRRFGVAAVATIAAGFVAGQSVTSEVDRRLVLRAVTVALLGAFAYGVAEAMGSGVPLDQTSGRLGATYGSPAYLGAALSLMVPVTVGAAMDRSEHRWWRAAAAVAAGGGLFLLAGSGTRAAVVGLVAAGVAVGAGRWSHLRRRWAAVAAVAVAAVMVMAWAPIGERIADAVTEPDQVGRIDEWRLGAAALMEHPVTGVGWEGYRIAFPSVVDPGYVRAYGRSTVTDRAHSGPLDAGISLGIAGVALWVVGAVWVVVRSVALLRRIDVAPGMAGVAAGLVGFFVAQLGMFPTVEVDVAAWMLVGVMVAAGADARSLRARSTPAAVGLFVLALGTTAAGILGMSADRTAAGVADGGAVAVADAAVAMRPDSFRLRLLAAETAYRAADVEGALERMDEALSLSPDDPGLRVAKARILATAARADQSRVDEASAFLDRAVAADPAHPKLRYLDGVVHLLAGEAVAAEHALLAAEALAPADADIPLALAELYTQVGEDAAASAALARAARIDPEAAESSGLWDHVDAP